MMREWFLGLPTTILGEATRLHAPSGMKALWHSLSRADRIVIGSLLVLLVIWALLAFTRGR